MPLVSITRLRVRSSRYLPIFILQAFRAALQAKGAPGSRSVTLLRDANRTFWTRTVWTDEQAMKQYMLAGLHRRVMPRLLEWCDEAALVSWIQEGEEPPSWAEAHRRIQQSGRASKVNHPSEAHRAHQIAPPARPQGGLVLK
jgi:heme-degrading monooxygenase HmoA